MDLYLSMPTLSITRAQSFPVSITAPLYDTVFTAGGMAVVTWTEPRSPIISQITLIKGPIDEAQSILQVATNVESEGEKFTWRIPADFPTGDDYAFELGTAPNVTYTGFFIIKRISNRPSFLNTSYGASAAKTLASATSQLPIGTFKLIAACASIAAGTAFLLI
jgi:Ser-Thr-rich glycosyl-phosphatidyl-inositol-anchored membrane family